MASDIWLRTIQIAREETRCRTHGLLFSINSKDSFYMHHPTDRIPHTTAFVTPVKEHWLEGEIAQWRIDPTTHRTMSELSYHGATSRSCRKDEAVCVVPASFILIWLINTSWRRILHLSVNTVSVFWQFATFWWSAIILLKQGKIYLVGEMWLNHLD